MSPRVQSRPSTVGLYLLARGEAHVGSKRTGLDDDVLDRSAVAENAVAFPQCPINRGAAIEADVEPLVKPAQSGSG